MPWSARESSQTGTQGLFFTNNTIVGLANEADNVTYSDIKEYSFKVSKQYKAISSEPPKSVVKGKLIYTYPGKASTTRPLANTPISIISCYVTGPDGYTKIVKTNKYEEYEDAIPGHKYLVHLLRTQAVSLNLSLVISQRKAFLTR
ncbi:MAG: hypothetical protein HC831_03630 [Chloroflexia bacterium]|nr:hypothetical protein [Chloroflexia bacterium]